MELLKERYLSLNSLETLEEHNKRMSSQQRIFAESAYKTGVSCPLCGGELFKKGCCGIIEVALSDPPQYPVSCSCGYNGFIL